MDQKQKTRNVQWNNTRSWFWCFQNSMDFTKVKQKLKLKFTNGIPGAGGKERHMKPER